MGLVLMAGIGVWSIKKSFGVVPTPAEQTMFVPVNKFAIEKLRQRTYEANLQFEKELQSRLGFRSEIVSYASDGHKQYALKNTPLSAMPEGGWPLIIVAHGYIEPSKYRLESDYQSVTTPLTRAGFVVMKPDYRGHDKSEGEAGKVWSRVEYAVDVLNLLAGIEKLPDVNSRRIYIWGHSMGGDVALRVVETTDHIKAASLWAPAVYKLPDQVTWFSRDDSERLQTVNEELNLILKPDEYIQVETRENLQYVGIPILVQHAKQDESVPYAWGEELVSKMRAKGIMVKFNSYEGDHNISQNFSQAIQRDVEFFSNY